MNKSYTKKSHWVIGWWEPRARWRAQRDWGGACRREVGGLGDQKGIVCCADDVRSFPWKMASVASGCCIPVSWDLQRSQEASGFWTLSHPSSPSKSAIRESSHFAHLSRDASVCLGLFLFLLSTPLFLAVRATQAGQMDRSLPLRLLWGLMKGCHGGCSEGTAMKFRQPSSLRWGGSSLLSVS